MVVRVQAGCSLGKVNSAIVVAQQWLNNRTVYLDFAACSLHSSNQPAIAGGGGGVGQDHVNTNFADSALLLPQKRKAILLGQQDLSSFVLGQLR